MRAPLFVVLLLAATVAVSGHSSAQEGLGDFDNWRLAGSFSFDATASGTSTSGDGTNTFKRDHREQHHWTVRLPSEGLKGTIEGQFSYRYEETQSTSEASRTEVSTGNFSGSGEATIGFRPVGTVDGYPAFTVSVSAAKLPGTVTDPGGTRPAQGGPNLTFTFVAGQPTGQITGLSSSGGVALSTVGAVQTAQLRTLALETVELSTGVGDGGDITTTAGFDCAREDLICVTPRDITQSLTWVATPFEGQRFVKWEGCDSDDGLRCTVNGPEQHDVRAFFDALPCAAAIPGRSATPDVTVPLDCRTSTSAFARMTIAKAVAQKAGLDKTLVGRGKTTKAAAKSISVTMGEVTRQALVEAGYKKLTATVSISFRTKDRGIEDSAGKVKVGLKRPPN